MLRFLNKLNLKWKFVAVVTAIVFLISLLQNLIFYRFYIHTYSQSIANKMSVLAQVLAGNSTPAIQFRSREDALEVLGSLRQEPSVSQAYLFDEDGRLLAEYLLPGTAMSVPMINIERRELHFTDDNIVIQQPVQLGDRRIGAIYIVATLDDLKEKAAIRFAYGCLALILATLLAYLFSLWGQRLFIQPVISLSGLAHKIGLKKQYHLRATKQSDDELGMLVDSFNSMLAAIETRDRELSEQRRELENSNKELEQFAYVISHDLKSPLVTIQGFAGRFLKYLDEGERERSVDAAQRVQNVAKRMGLLIDDVLELSRAGRKRGQMRLVDIRAELVSIREDLLETLDAAQASLTIGDDLPKVYADPGEMRRVLQNLITNSIKYGCPTPGMNVTVGGEQRKDGKYIYVKDHGPGIPEEYHQKIFQLFQRLSQDKQGTGLGLAIVSKVMKSLSGRAWVESKPGQGAVFWLQFPGGELGNV